MKLLSFIRIDTWVSLHNIPSLVPVITSAEEVTPEWIVQEHSHTLPSCKI